MRDSRKKKKSPNTNTIKRETLVENLFKFPPLKGVTTYNNPTIICSHLLKPVFLVAVTHPKFTVLGAIKLQKAAFLTRSCHHRLTYRAGRNFTCTRSRPTSCPPTWGPRKWEDLRSGKKQRGEVSIYLYYLPPTVLFIVSST